MSNLHPLFQTILKPFTLPVHLRDNDASFLRCSKCGRKSWGGDAVNAACAMPKPDGTMCEGLLEGQTPERSGVALTPEGSDAVAHYTKTDPGQSSPADCVHSMFAIGRSRYQCAHCRVIVDWGEGGES